LERRATRIRANVRATSPRESSPSTTKDPDDVDEASTADASVTELWWAGSATARTFVPEAEKVVIEPMSSR
jgi:hypothetical protein